MEDLIALFHQYETDYCNKSTDISRKISSLASITGGVHVAVSCFVWINEYLSFQSCSSKGLIVKVMCMVLQSCAERSCQSWRQT